jgi:hypothetical protein
MDYDGMLSLVSPVCDCEGGSYLINDYFTPWVAKKEKLVEKLINEQIHKQLVDLFTRTGAPLRSSSYIGCHQARIYGQLLEEVCSVSGFTCFANP